MSDKEILRELLKKKVEYSHSLRNEQSREKWYAANDLKMTKPPVFINELPWHEFMDDSLELKCVDPGLRGIETSLRRELFVYEKFVTDNVIEPFIECSISYTDTGTGISEDTDTVKTNAASDVVSRHFNIQIRDFEDIPKIKEPTINLLPEETERKLNRLSDVFGTSDIVLTGAKGYWFTPWDNLVRLTGVQEMLYDLVDRPEFIHALLRRFLDSSMVRMKRYSELGIWASNNDGTRVGSGGCGFTKVLSPLKNPNVNIPVSRLWGCGNAQIFTDVSPDMHWEFSLQYELEWMKHFGLNYYGCCERLDNKIDILGKIPNLRKISISPWADVAKAAERIGIEYVMSIKPNPAVFAVNKFPEEQALADIRMVLDHTKGRHFEIVIKDVSTTAYNFEKITKYTKLLDREIRKIYE